MIVEIVKDDRRWCGVVTAVSLERSEAGVALIVRSNGDYGSATYPTERWADAVGTYEQVIGGLVEEHLEKTTIALTIEDGKVVWIDRGEEE